MRSNGVLGRPSTQFICSTSSTTYHARLYTTFLATLRDALGPGGRLIIKDVSDRPLYKQLFTLVLDRLMVGREPIYYWPPHEIMAELRRVGFSVKKHSMNDILPYPHVIYACTRLES